MKKIAALLLSACVAASAWTAPAQAVEVKASGMMNILFEGTQNVQAGNQFRSYNDGGSHQKHFGAVQRLWITLDFIASENISARYQLEVGTFTWGGPASGEVYAIGSGNSNGALGGALGSRAPNLATRQAYLEWMIPNTDARVTFGLQPMALPSYAFISPILDNQGTGIVLNVPVNENFTVDATWLAAFSDTRRGTPILKSSENTHDTMNMGSLAVTARYDGFKVTPWAALGQMGRDVTRVDGRYNTVNLNSGMLPVTGYTMAKKPSDSTFWFAGFGMELTQYDPFRLAFDFYYSSSRTRYQESNRSGWYAALSAEYKTQYGVPTFKAWYSTGDDDNAKNGSERALSIKGGFTPGASVFFNTFRTSIADTVNRGDASGMWGVSAQWNGLSLLPKLSHSMRLTYVRGTNSPDMAPFAVASQLAAQRGNMRAVGGPTYYMTSKDSLLELDIDSDYMIYRNLFAKLELSYVWQNFNGDVWKAMNAGRPADFSNAWRAALGMTYIF